MHEMNFAFGKHLEHSEKNLNPHLIFTLNFYVFHFFTNYLVHNITLHFYIKKFTISYLIYF